MRESAAPPVAPNPQTERPGAVRRDVNGRHAPAPPDRSNWRRDPREFTTLVGSVLLTFCGSEDVNASSSWARYLQAFNALTSARMALAGHEEELMASVRQSLLGPGWECPAALSYIAFLDTGHALQLLDTLISAALSVHGSTHTLQAAIAHLPRDKAVPVVEAREAQVMARNDFEAWGCLMELWDHLGERARAEDVARRGLQSSDADVRDIAALFLSKERPAQFPSPSQGCMMPALVHGRSGDDMRVHFAVAVADLAQSIAEYSKLLGQPPVVVVPEEYALWRTAELNFSIRRTADVAGTVRHVGFEREDAAAFSTHVDVNGLVWETFSSRHQAAEIAALWPGTHDDHASATGAVPASPFVAAPAVAAQRVMGREPFVQSWLAAWNSHDLDAIMSLYHDDVTLVSPTAQELLGDPAGEVKGKAALRAYFDKGLQAYPNLRFELLDVMWGLHSVVLCLLNQKGTRTAELMELDPAGMVTRVVAHYSR